MLCSICVLFFFFNDTATTEIYTLSLHDALPVVDGSGERSDRGETEPVALRFARQRHQTWRRLEAKDSAACGGNPDRAAAVGPERQRGHARRDRYRPPPAPSAGRGLRPPPVPG